MTDVADALASLRAVADARGGDDFAALACRVRAVGDACKQPAYRESLAAEGGVEAVAAALETCNAIAARVFEAADAVPDIAEGLATRLTFKRAPSTAGDGENSVFAACVELARTSQFLAAAGITAQLRVWDSGLADQLAVLVTRGADGDASLAAVGESSRRLAQRATLLSLRAIANAVMGNRAAAARAWRLLGGTNVRDGAAWVSLEGWLHSLAGDRAAVAAAAAVVDACAAGYKEEGEGTSEGTGEGEEGAGEGTSEGTGESGGPTSLVLTAPSLARVLLHRLVPERELQFRQVGGDRDGEVASVADVAAATGQGAGVAATGAAAAMVERSRKDAEAAANPASDPARHWLLLPLLRCWCSGQWRALWASQGAADGATTHEQLLLACATEEAVRDWRDATPRPFANGSIPFAPLSSSSLHAVAATAAALLTGPCMPRENGPAATRDAAVLSAVHTRFAAEAALSLVTAIADACECVCAAAAAPSRGNEDDGGDSSGGGSGASCALPAAVVDSALLDTPFFHAACSFLHAWRPLPDEPVSNRLARVPEVPVLLSAALRCIGNACFRRPPAQLALLAHDGRGIGAVLGFCRIDDRIPLLREWALMSVRNACEGCGEVQRFVAQLAPRAMAPTTALQHTDMRLELDSEGRPRVRRGADG